tara:strand:+ start:128 stop:382 length:255 start_codon:yes stop_codon:yes gene_type:complete
LKISHKITPSQIDYGLITFSKNTMSTDVVKQLPDVFDVFVFGERVIGRKFIMKNRIWMGCTVMKKFEKDQIVRVEFGEKQIEIS